MTDLAPFGRVQAPTDDQPGVWRRRAFALFPVNDLRRRHVRFDTAVWVDHLYQELYDVGVEGLQEDAFSSLFKGGDVLKYREDVSKLRSAKKGWVIGRSFTCNGVSLGITYYNPLRKVRLAVSELQTLLRCVNALEWSAGVQGGQGGSGACAAA